MARSTSAPAISALTSSLVISSRLAPSVTSALPDRSSTARTLVRSPSPSPSRSRSRSPYSRSSAARHLVRSDPRSRCPSLTPSVPFVHPRLVRSIRGRAANDLASTPYLLPLVRPLPLFLLLRWPHKPLWVLLVSTAVSRVNHREPALPLRFLATGQCLLWSMKLSLAH